MGREARATTGTIAFVSPEAHVWPAFAACLARLTQRHPRAFLIHVTGTNIAHARNMAVREMQGDWIWFIDTDMTFDPATLERLLAWGEDVVQPLVLLRHQPHYPVAYRLGEDGAIKQIILNDQTPGLLEVHAVGTGGTLFRRKALEKVPDPWFELGRLRPDELGEDMWLSRKLREAGVKMWCDLTTPTGHLTAHGVWPKVGETGWWETALIPTAGPAIVISAARS